MKVSVNLVANQHSSTIYKTDIRNTATKKCAWADPELKAKRAATNSKKTDAEIKEVISFADRRWSKGNLYEKIGFLKIEETVPSYYYIIDRKLHNRMEFQKHKLVADGADPNKTEHEIMKEKGALRIYDCGCLKYKWQR